MTVRERRVTLYFDFVSPYSWMALSQVETLARRHGVVWELRPVVYAALLDAHGLIGPAEVEAKRRYTFHDVSLRGGARPRVHRASRASVPLHRGAAYRVPFFA